MILKKKKNDNILSLNEGEICLQVRKYELDLFYFPELENTG